jgi:hypothetical protein
VRNPDSKCDLKEVVIPNEYKKTPEDSDSLGVRYNTQSKEVLI